jgi:radical SAM superfamily enzyme YgiQ (UPF0313 family)
LIRAGRRVKESGILLSVTVILGLGGVEGSQRHAVETGKVLSEMDPDYVGALSLMIVPGTPIEKEIETGKLVLPTPFGLIQELEWMIEIAISPIAFLLLITLPITFRSKPVSPKIKGRCSISSKMWFPPKTLPGCARNSYGAFNLLPKQD